VFENLPFKHLILLILNFIFDLLVNVGLAEDIHALMHAACRCLVSVGWAFMVRFKQA